MKNQYFGDNRDLFKYDLILEVIQKTRSVNRFTFIPMLTQNDDTKQGGERDRDKAKCGKQNKDLIGFLNEFKDKSKRDIKELESFFKKKAISMKIYYGKEKYFSHEKREEYFKQIGDGLLPKSLVFVDPDIGLQVKRTRDKHIRYCEVKSLYERMGKSSILMIFQFIPRVKRETYFAGISEKLREQVEDSPLCISDNQIVFFFLTKDNSVRESLSKVIRAYKRSYDELDKGACLMLKGKVHKYGARGLKGAKPL